MALPSLRSVEGYNIIYSEYNIIDEGVFRFDELSNHIKRYNLSGLVTIGEDATHVISRVEYDKQTDRCVGFVLPMNEKGLPMVDSFLASSYEAIERMFSTSVISKYAYVCIVKPLDFQSPSFFLGFIGSNNRFDAETVLFRLKYIVSECQKCGIHILSFKSDGDTRLMKAMKECTG